MIPFIEGTSSGAGNAYLAVIESNINYEAFVCQLIKDLGDVKQNLNHMLLGTSGENGELVDAIKKYTIYNKELDLVNVVEELGDLEFYLAGIRQLLGINREWVLTNNLVKLQARYPTGSYSDEAAQTRADKLPEVIDVTSEEYKLKQGQPEVSPEAVVAVDDVAAAAVDKAYDEGFPLWGQQVIKQFGPDPRPPVLSFRVSSNGERLTVLFEGDTAAKNFFKPKD